MLNIHNIFLRIDIIVNNITLINIIIIDDCRFFCYYLKRKLKTKTYQTCSREGFKVIALHHEERSVKASDAVSAK